MRLSQSGQPKTAAPGTAPRLRVGHRMYCAKCGDMKVQSIVVAGNGTPILERCCAQCGRTERFEFVGGGWIPESVVRSLENFTGGRIGGAEDEMAEQTDEAIDAERRKDDVDEMLYGEDAELHWRLRTPAIKRIVARLKAWMFLIPAVPLLTMGPLGVLAYMKPPVYVHPIYEWIAPYYQPWMNSAWFIVGPFACGLMLILAYLAARLSRSMKMARETLKDADEVLDPKSLRDGKLLLGEFELLREMDDF